MFSETLNHRSVAQTCTPNSRRRKIDDAARPQPRSSTRMPGRKFSAEVSHSVSQSEFAPPLALARTHSGWYCEDRGKFEEMNRWSEVTVPDSRTTHRRDPSAVLVQSSDLSSTREIPSQPDFFIAEASESGAGKAPT